MVKFDCVIGNPPYSKGKDKLLYRRFMTIAEKHSKRIVTMVTPNFASLTRNKKLPKWLTFYRQLPNNTFDIDLPSGTCYFIQDKENESQQTYYANIKQNVNTNNLEIVKDCNAISIREKIKSFNTLEELYYRPNIKPTPGTKYLYIDKNGRQNGDPVYIKTDIPPTRELKTWKVISGYNYSTTAIGHTRIAGPETYISYSLVCLRTKTKEEAERLQTYINSDLVRYLIANYKTAFNNSKKLFNLLPQIPLDRDINLYDYFNLTEEERENINTQ